MKCTIAGCETPAEVRLWFEPGDEWSCRPHWEEFVRWQQEKYSER